MCGGGFELLRRVPGNRNYPASSCWIFCGTFDEMWNWPSHSNCKTNPVGSGVSPEIDSENRNTPEVNKVCDTVK
jgi:hypothetical protein